MGSDQLIELLSQVCYKLLPVAGLVLLVFLIIFFKHLIVTLKALAKTLETTNEQVRKLDKPLATVEDLSETVDKIHNASKGAVGKGLEFAKNNAGVVVDKFKRKPKETEMEVDEDGK